MKLEQLLEGVPFTLAQGSLDTEISDIIYDSRKAASGLLFVCIVGTQRDSHEFAADCAAKGVSALVIQHDIDLSAMPGVTVVKVESSRYAMALMSANLFGNPSRKMTMIGVTGTKGKTTTTHMIKSVLEAAGRKVGMIGTNGIYYMGRHKETANTTPESYELQKTFREFLDAGCDTALMEVSSQGLMMDRVAGVHYNVGVFTNLSPDHIGPGEHKTFEEYRSWKGQLFKRCDVGVVNIDDENTEALLEGHTCKLVTYGRDEKADYRETGYELLRTHDFLGVKFHVTGKDEMDVKVNMPGEFSVYNALAALAVGKVLGLPDAAIHDGLGKCVVKEVLGQAVYYNGQYANCTYFSISCGVTTTAQSVWGTTQYPYLVSVDSSIDVGYTSGWSSYQQTKTFTAEEVASRMNSYLGTSLDAANDDPATWLEIQSRTDGLYVGTVRVGNTTTTGRKIRDAILGLRSHAFDIGYDESSRTFTFTTYGYGHGVGMSQTGSNLYAKQGWTYVQILNHYYPGTTVA